MKHFTTQSCAPRLGFMFVALLAGALAQAQSLNVTAANASNDAIYTVDFDAQTIHVQNTDQGSLHSLRSLTFIPNLTNNQLDLLAADNNGGTIVRYCADFNTAASPAGKTTGTPVWNQTQGGPTNPDGLSVDSAGNLFVVNQGSGTSTSPQLWVLKQLAGCVASPQAPTIVPIDAAYGSKQTLEETVVAGTTIPLPPNTVCLPPPGACLNQISPGDLLVLSANPSVVLLYPGVNGQGPSGPTMPFTLINLPAGTSPGGMAFWPVDNSLLVTTSTGTIYQYSFVTSPPQPPFSPNETPGTFNATGLGNGQYKIKTGRQNGNVFAFVANNNGGDILKFNSSGQVISTVTNGVQHPQGLAVSNIGYQPFASCDQRSPAGSCDVLGDTVLAHQVTNVVGQLPGNVIEDVCLVPQDPRGQNCSNAANYPNGLPVAQVCAGFDNYNNASPTLFIPNTMCGASGSGASPSGFALVKTLTQSYANEQQNQFPLNATLINSTSDLTNLLPGTNPVCPTSNFDPHNSPPFGVLAWAPLMGEGVLAESNPAFSPTPQVVPLVDITDGCGSSHGSGGTLSVWAVGLQQVGSPVGFATTKYTNLLGTLNSQYNSIANASPLTYVLTQPSPPPASFPANSPPPQLGNFTYQLQQCLQTSQGAFQKSSAYYGGAAAELLTADQSVATNLQYFTPNGSYPNPSGALRSRARNLYYTINTEIQGNGALTAPPAPSPPPAPSISGTPSTNIKAGAVYTFTPIATDFAGNTGAGAHLTFTIVNGPSWATFFSGTGQLTGVAVKGTYSGIVISVTDGCTSASLNAFTIKVK